VNLTLKVKKDRAEEDMRVPLSEAEIGPEYIVERIVCRGLVRKRIIDMGIIPGSSIKVLRTAPLGDPLEVLVKGFPLSIRRSEASCIIVKKVVK